jgi:stage III sporulation protein AF
MVEVLVTIVKNLLVIVVIASFLEILLPDSSVRPFVRFAIGLFVILAILNPILAVFFSGRAMQAGAWDLPWEYEESGDYQEVGREVNRDIQKVGSELIREKIEQQISSTAILVPGIGDLQTRVIMTSGEGKLSGIEMVIVPISTVPEADSVTAFSSREQQNQEREIIVKKLTSMMKNLYGLNEDQVVIKFKGE